MFKLSKNWRPVLGLGVCAALAFGAVDVQAGDTDGELRALIERQSRLLEEQGKQLQQQGQQIEDLKRRSESTLAPAGDLKADDASIKKAVADALKETDAKKKADDEAKKKKLMEEGYVVGSDTKMTANWNNGLKFSTENKDFQMHIGGRFDFDSVWWDQPANTRGAAPGGNLGIFNPGSTGVGQLDDGMFFRRVRLVFDGTAYEQVEFNVETNFEGLTSIAFDDLYVGMKDLPFIGTVRFGQMKVPQGLESYSSSRGLPTMERSGLFDAFWQEFGVGAFASNTMFDQRATWAAMFHRVEVFGANNGAEFGDGDYAFTTRLTALPFYENDGRCLVHVGGSYQWRNAELDRTTGLAGTPLATVPAGVDDAHRIVRFRDRPELRDAVGSQGNGSRFLDTGNIIADSVNTFAGEFLAINGPLSVQAEATYAMVDDATYPAAAGGTNRGTLGFWGAYAQVGYFLTGESRPYDRRFGRIGANLKPNENFFLVRDENNSIHSGWGAWELIYRYSFVDLNDNSGVVGGMLSEQTVGVNWYWNPNVKLQLNYVWADRNTPAPANSGTIQGIGARVHYDF